MSQFVRDIQGAQVEPIQPRFVDVKNDLTISQIRKGLPLYYVKNNDNGLFELTFRYDFGQSADNRYDVAADYLEYLGTDKLSATAVHQRFYELACNYAVTVTADNINVSLTGLSENMPAALELLENLMANLKADPDAYNQLVDLTLKRRDDQKKSQRAYFDALYRYATFGPRNSFRDMMTAQQLRETDPQTLVDLLKGLGGQKHSVVYYGPMTAKQLTASLNRLHQTPKLLADGPVNQPYVQQPATKNWVWIAPYDAKNIYMRMYHNEQRPWNPDEAATVTLFNEYFGGGMNGIVFQELREARGLAYNAYAVYSRPSRLGQKESYFTHIITQNDKMADCISQFHSILNNLPASENAFQIAKDAATKQLASQRTTRSSIIWAYLAAKRLGLDYDLNEKIYNGLSAVTLQDLVNFEQSTMANKQYRYIILGDYRQLDMPTLEKIGPVKHLTTEEVFGY
jgi:predicted Zn-dependent peptidase